MMSDRFNRGVVACALTAALSGITRGEIVQWPVADGGNGHFYEVVEAPKGIAWIDATIDAETRNGFLVTITSPAENAFVFDLISDPALWSPDTNNAETSFWLHGPWIGLQQDADAVEPAGGWSWVDDEGPLGWSNWYPGEPNNTYYPNYDLYEDVAHFLAFDTSPEIVPAPTWNDRPDSLNPVPVISYVIEYIPAAPTIAPIAIGAMFLTRRRR